MITCIIGNKNESFQKKYQQVLALAGGSLVPEKIIVTRENFSETIDMIITPSLFGDKKIFVTDSLLGNDELKKLFFTSIKEIADAPNDVIIINETILAPDRKKIEPVATMHIITEKNKKESSFDTFALVNAFATGDRKKTWIVFQQLINQEDEMEKIHGMIWWKIKDMLQKKNNFDSKKITAMARSFVDVYHQSRLGGIGMKEQLEKFFLTMQSITK